MDKIQINIQIVLMRKFVKQAKVHNINRLVKEAKLLQNRKGNEAQVLKAKRKADHFLEEVALLKKIKPDDISKLALSKAKDWSSVLQQKNISLDDRCIAMLANYESVQKEVEKFYNENQHLVPRIITLIKEWNSKSKKMNNKSSKGIKASESKFKNNKKKLDKMPWVPKNIISQNHDISEENIQLKDKNNVSMEEENYDMKKNDAISNIEVNTSNITYELDNQNESVESCSLNEGETDDESEDSLRNSDDDDEICQKSSSELQNVSSLSKVNPESKENKQEEESTAGNMNVASLENVPSKMNSVDIQSKSKNSLKAVAMLNLEKLQGFDEIPINKTSDQENSEDEISINSFSGQESNENKTIIAKSDPFFLGSHEVSFVSENDPDKSDEKVFQNRQSYMSERPKFPQRQERDNSYSKMKKNSVPYQSRKSYGFKDKDLHFKSHNTNKYQNTNERNFTNFPSPYHNRKTFSFKNEDLQFENCKRERTQNTDKRNFKMMKNEGQNKSNMFRNNRHDLNEVQFKNIANKRPFFNEKQKSPCKKSKKADDFPLHPSWEAKRKLKEIANTSAKGKRIVFND